MIKSELLTDYLERMGYSDKEFGAICGRTRMTIWNRKNAGWRVREALDGYIYFVTPSGEVRGDKIYTGAPGRVDK